MLNGKWGQMKQINKFNLKIFYSNLVVWKENFLIGSQLIIIQGKQTHLETFKSVLLGVINNYEELGVDYAFHAIWVKIDIVSEKLGL